MVVDTLFSSDPLQTPKSRANAANTSRRRFLAGIGAAALLATSDVTVAHAAPSPDIADWGGLNLLDSNDKAFKIHELENQLTLIVVWANWCSRCMRELTTIANLTKTVGGRNLELILVSHPDDWEINQKVIAQRDLVVRCARPSPTNDADTLRRAFVSDDGVFYVPHSILFSRQHQMVVWNHVGALDYTSEAALTPVRKWLPA